MTLTIGTTKIIDLLEFKPPKPKGGAAELSYLGSDWMNRFGEGAQKDGGEWSFAVPYSPETGTSCALGLAAFASGASTDFEAMHRTGKGFDYESIITDYEIAFDAVNNIQKVTFTCAVNGEISEVTGS
ncbi:MAG: hypothetical protein ABS70_00540 [Nitrospira sp. SCN 59-13]|nr:MAG: hypothetical protein ABS70_00540 [Nitrospira sp. SCN 59-13]